MINGIENFDANLQKAILGCIASSFDMSEDIEVEELEDNVIQINDVKYYVITDDDQQRKIAGTNSDRFENFFDGLDDRQLEYVDRDAWEVDYGIQSFHEWLDEELGYYVIDNDYYNRYNFYEIH